MNIMKLDTQKGYYTTIKGVLLRIDTINNRLKIMDFQNISEEIIEEIISFAKVEKLGKIVTHCRIGFLRLFTNRGFKCEGRIQGYFSGQTAYCAAYFVDRHRALSEYLVQEESILRQCMTDRLKPAEPLKHVEIRTANENDIPELLVLFSTIFASYPAPIFEREYLRRSMKENVLYKVAVEHGRIIAAASAQMDRYHWNAEITECATYPEHRGRGILPKMIESIETELRDKKFYVLYSLARAKNIGINRSLYKLGFEFDGRLINHYNICGGLEDLNIWVKRI